MCFDFLWRFVSFFWKFVSLCFVFVICVVLLMCVLVRFLVCVVRSFSCGWLLNCCVKVCVSLSCCFVFDLWRKVRCFVRSVILFVFKRVRCWFKLICWGSNFFFVLYFLSLERRSFCLVWRSLMLVVISVCFVDVIFLVFFLGGGVERIFWRFEILIFNLLICGGMDCKWLVCVVCFCLSIWVCVCFLVNCCCCLVSFDLIFLRVNCLV